MGVKILAWDYSGSTAGTTHYHTHGWNYIQQFVDQVLEPENSQDQFHYLLWDTECQAVKLKELQEICKSKKGRGGTDPSCLVNWILQNLPDQTIELWLITDGEIGSFELAKCARLNLGVNYSKIKFIVLNKQKINLSVGASFFRGAALQIFHDDHLKKTINTAVPFDYAKITLANFDAMLDELGDFIQAKFMGSDLDGLEEADKLNALRKRLLDELSKQNSAQENADKKSELYPEFLSKKKTEILEGLKNCAFYRNLTTPAVADFASRIDGSISTLINYIHNKYKSYDFTSLKMDYKQSKMATVMDEPDPELSDLGDVETCNFYDAVTLEEEQGAPILLLTVTDLIQKYWAGEGGNYSKFRTIMDCPFKARIDECIGHVYLIETFNALSANANSGDGDVELTNPMTNQPVFGGLIFSEKADKWNDYVLAKTFFRGKKVNTNIGLWYYVIWKNAENKEWIEAAVLDQLKAYAFRRLANTKVRLGFSSLPMDPKEIVSVPIACFYCTEGSSLLFGQHADLFLQERLRMFGSIADHMLEILEHFGYDDIDVEFVKERAKTFGIMTSLKHIPQEIEKRYALLQKIFESKGKFLTYELKDKSALKYLNLLNYHHKNSMIPFDYGKTAFDFRPFVLISYKFEDQIPDFQICRETFRPYFVVKDKNGLGPYYNQVLACISNVEVGLDGESVVGGGNPVTQIDHRKLLGLCRIYINLTNELRKFPTFEEFTDYIYKIKRINENKLIRLFPIETLESIQLVFDMYAGLGANIDEFIEKTQKSVSIEARIEMEKVLKGNKSHWKEFIANAKTLTRG